MTTATITTGQWIESETSERKLELRVPDALFNYGLKKETENA